MYDNQGECAAMDTSTAPARSLPARLGAAGSRGVNRVSSTPRMAGIAEVIPFLPHPSPQTSASIGAQPRAHGCTVRRGIGHVCHLNGSPRDCGKEVAAMGAARIVTADGLDAFAEYRAEVERAMADHRITPIETARCRTKAAIVEDRLATADNQMRLIRFATGNVRRIRSIEEHCARANVSPIAFDLGPEAA